jgi:serine/threonine protein kinase
MSDNYPQIILASTDPDLPPDIPVGFAKYTQFHEMTRGRKAVLHSCWDQIVGRTVAMKRLLPEFAADVRERRRFLREARVTAQLQHPNTVPVYELGRDDQNGLYFTMKKIAGENYFRILHRLAQKDPHTLAAYPLTERLEVVIQACQALGYGHIHGVIHRDVKPENLWVGKFGEVILLDWGVSKVWGMPDMDHDTDREEESDESAEWQVNSLATADGGRSLEDLTETGQRFGTPLYMSPEQVNAKAYIDERTDVFSMGVMIYEMLTFKEPFRGHNVIETFKRIVHSTPKLPSQIQPDAGIPESLDALVMKAISKKPDDRFHNMVDMIRALRAARNDVEG